MIADWSELRRLAEAAVLDYRTGTKPFRKAASPDVVLALLNELNQRDAELEKADNDLDRMEAECVALRERVARLEGALKDAIEAVLGENAT